MRKVVLLINLVHFACSVTAHSIATGYVFNDTNGDARMDNVEKGTVGVAVSSGSDVAVTDSKGKYWLPNGLDNIISVIKPGGCKV